MKISVTQTSEVEISEKEAKRITIATLGKHLSWDPAWFINKENKVMVWKEYATSHSWNSLEEIRPASERDKIIAGIFYSLQNIRYKCSHDV